MYRESSRLIEHRGTLFLQPALRKLEKRNNATRLWLLFPAIENRRRTPALRGLSKAKEGLTHICADASY